MLRVFHISLSIIILLSTLSFSAAQIAEEDQTDADRAWIGGKIIWSEHDLSRASVSVFRDPGFKDLYTKGLLLKPEGMYTLRIDDPGTYYIVTFVDDNGNNRFDEGDGMGIYGVTNWEDRNQKPVPVQLEKGENMPGIDIQVLAVVDNQGRMASISALAAASVSGISGKLVWPDHKFSNTDLFVYSDPAWNNRVAQAEVGENGEYEIGLPPGKYYLLAVVDENNTNLLDAGDKFGIWGVTKLGMFPKAVEVKEGQINRDRNILVMNYEGQAEKIVPPEDKINLSGNLLWPEHDLRFGMVQAYSDPSMTVAAAQAKTDGEGNFEFDLPAGDYYVVAGVDLDGDGKYTAGDGIGAYGAANAADQMPEKLTVTEETGNKGISLVITAEFDDSGQLKPISYQTQQSLPDVFPETSLKASSTGISGKIEWEGKEISEAILIFSNEQRFETGVRISLKLDEGGLYICSVPPGDYYVMAIVDLIESDGMNAGGGRGFYGSGYWDTPPHRFAVIEGHITPFININVTGLFGSDGKTSPFQPPGSIRFHYGDPDDINIDQDAVPATQEWWYWSKGITFTFEETDAGWNLTDTYEFDPQNVQEEKSVEETFTKRENSSGTLYYTFDRSIWGVDADGTNRRRIAPGSRLTGTLDGDKLLFPDTQGSVYLIEPGNDASAQLILGRRKTGLQPTISYDGKAMAFALDSGDGYRKMILKNLENGEESALPVGNMDLYDPAWTLDSSLIAYSAALPSSSDQRDRNRDIYYYDLNAGRAERVSTSALDEFGPAWSPVDTRILVYCRAEGDHSQLWRVDFDADGKPVERQLTKYGGQNPAWSPGGDKIIYENNAQLWIIDPDGINEMPLIVDDEPIFGMHPFWTR